MKKILLTLLMIFTVFSCGSSNNKKDTLILNLNEEGATLDTTLITDNNSGTTQTFLSEGLTKLDKDGNLTLGLAKSITPSKDGLTYDIVIRDDAKWSNGEPITSNDFKYSWIRALDPKTASNYAYMLYPIKNAEKFNSGKAKASDLGIEIINDKHFKVYLEKVTPYFDSLLGFTTYLPLNEKFVKKQGDQYALEKENLLYSGPYVIKDWVHGSKIVLTKNPYYYDAKNIKIPNVVIKYIVDDSSSLNAYRNGELDVHELNAEQYKEFKNNDNIREVDEATVWYLIANTKNKYLKNVNIRKAIQLAINRDKLAEVVFDDVTAKPLYALTPANVGIKGVSKDFVSELYDSGYEPHKYNVEEAKKDLALGLKELGITKLPALSIICNDAGYNKKVVEFIQEQLRENLGITIKIDVMTYKERIQRTYTGNFDMVYSGWGADFLDPINFLELLYYKNGNNYARFDNPTYNKLIEKAYNESDKVQRTKYLIDAEKVLSKEVPLIYLVQSKNLYIVNPSIKGLVLPSFGSTYYLNYSSIDNTK